MINLIVEQLLAQAAEGMGEKEKSMLRRVDEFMPLIRQYNDGIEKQEGKNEVGVAYVIRFETDKKDKEKTDIVLYQVMLAAKEGVNSNLPTFSRMLSRFSVSEKINELVK